MRPNWRLKAVSRSYLLGKVPFCLILSLDGLKHLVIDEASLFQALHEQMGLVLIHEQVILKCSHADILLQPIRNVKRIVPPAGGNSPTWLKPVALLPQVGRASRVAGA